MECIAAKNIVVWESMFKSDLLDTLHILVYCSEVSSSWKENSSEMCPSLTQSME